MTDAAMSGPVVSDEQLLEAVRAYTQRVPASGPYGPTRRIAGSDQDQRVPPGTSNPLWEIVRLLPTSPHGDLWGSGILRPDGHLIRELLAAGAGDFSQRYQELEPFTRMQLCKRYTWAIPSPYDIAWIARLTARAGRGVVEVGAGTGYWAWQLRQAGVDVVAYDPHPPGPDNGFASGGPYTTVLPGDHTAALAHQDRVLLMCWPGYGASWADELLAVWGGQTIIYCGEGWGGCTANDGFYKRLETEWEQIDMSGGHVQWDGIHDDLTLYQRRAEGGETHD